MNKQEEKQEEEKVEIDPIQNTDARKINLSKEQKKDIIRLKKENVGWREIREEITKKYGKKYSTTLLRDTYIKELAKTELVSPSRKKNYNTYNKILRKQYERVHKLTDFWLETLEKAKEDLEEQDITMDMRSLVKFLKLMESFDRVGKNILDRLKYEETERERIKVEQKNMIYSPMQINQKILEVRKTEQHKIEYTKRKSEELEKELDDKKRELGRLTNKINKYNKGGNNAKNKNS